MSQTANTFSWPNRYPQPVVVDDEELLNHRNGKIELLDLQFRMATPFPSFASALAAAEGKNPGNGIETYPELMEVSIWPFWNLWDFHKPFLVSIEDGAFSISGTWYQWVGGTGRFQCW
jgi:hypothetical protein